MKKYVIFKFDGTDSKEFVSTIYRNSLNHSSDIGDAIELDDMEQAKSLCNYINKRKESTTYKIMCIETKINII